MSKISKIFKLFIVSYLLFVAPFVHALYKIDFLQKDSDVIMNGKGSLDISGLPAQRDDTGITFRCSYVNPFRAGLSVHAYGNKPFSGWYNVLSGPDKLGEGEDDYKFSCEDVGGGGQLIHIISGHLFISPDYVSNTEFSNFAIWRNSTFSSIGLTPGSYEYSFGKAPNEDKIIINIIPNPPTIFSISPSAGPATGGTSVVITGTNFTGASAVKFGASNAAAFTVNSATQITATSPAGSAGTVDVTVVTAGGTSSISPSDQFTYVVRQTPVMNVITGAGTVFARIDSGSAGCSFDLAATSAIAIPNYNGTPPPLGGLKLKVTGCVVGETIKLAVTFSNLSGMTAMKYGPTPTSVGTPIWYTPNNFSISGNTISYSVTDNGIGDDTFTGPDGIINDPVVPLIAGVLITDVKSIPTLNENATLLLILLVGLFGASMHFAGFRGRIQK